jgi:hypothetical protein
MQVIPTTKVLYTTADEENANLLATNLMDEYPQKVWRATSKDAVVRVTVDYVSSAIAIFNTNAITINFDLYQLVVGTSTGVSNSKLIDSAATFSSGGVEAGDYVHNESTGSNTTVSSVDSETQLTLGADIFTSGQTYSVETDQIVTSETYDLSGITDILTFMTGETDPQHSLWIDYALQYGRCKAVLTMDTTAAGTTLEAGVIVAGVPYDWINPDYGLEETLVDYSPSNELDNGAHYYRKTNIARAFTGQIDLLRSTEFYQFMLKIAKNKGKTPLAWRIVKNDGDRWLVYARFMDMPSANHAWPQYAIVQFSLIEAI